MGFLGLTVCYLMRSNLSVAIVVMINSTSTDESTQFDSESFFGNKMYERETAVNGTSNGTCSNDDSSGNINTVRYNSECCVWIYIKLIFHNREGNSIGIQRRKG